MRFFIFVSVFCFTCFVGIIALFPEATFAETRIVSSDFAHIFQSNIATTTIVWDKKGSPYVLDETVIVPEHVALVINEGTTVIGSSTLDYSPYMIVTGLLQTRGTVADPVIFRDFGGVSGSRGRLSIRETHFLGMKSAIGGVGSLIDVDGSEIVDNEIGVESYPAVYLAKEGGLIDVVGLRGVSGTGGIGNALMNTFATVENIASSDKPEENRITIRNTYFSGNREYDIYNQTANIVDARHNWWEQFPAKIMGLVDTSEPNLFDEPEKCCSNVLFFPGIQASRLYVDSPGVVGNVLTNRLWEPNRNTDARKLFRGASSSLSGVYTKDIIDDAFGYGIYGRFINMMDDEVASGKMKAWKSYPYDWRDSVSDVAQADGLLGDFTSLASSSRTGKVTLVAHSNGGLLAKAFGRVLEEKGLLPFIDKVIFVAVPQLGTPQAIGALLHGDNQSILGGLILSSGVARHLGLSIAGAYGLIPSATFFTDEYGVNDAIGDIISFATGTTGMIAQFDFSRYGAGISRFSDMKDFFLARRDNRVQPLEGQTGLPAVLDSTLLSFAERMHDDGDDWHFASTTKVYSVAGWGLPTLSKLGYVERKSCLIGGCFNHLSIIPQDSILGDGTVLSRSASAYARVVSSSHSVFVHLGKDHADAVHSNILSSASVLNAVASIISASSSRLIPSDLYEIPNISERIPEEYKGVRSVRIGVHSPVDLHMYDDKGNHTGPAENPIPDSDFDFIEQDIPGSKYSVFGEDKYITISGIAPSSTATYTINVRGTGEGSFTLEMEEFAGDTLRATSSFENVPVTVGDSATTSVMFGVDGENDGLGILGDLEIETGAGAGTSSSSQKVLYRSSSRQRNLFLPVGGMDMSSTTSPYPSPYTAGFDLKTHVSRIVDLIKKNRLFLKSLSGPDRGVLLDLLQIL